MAEKILIVDDSPIARRLARSALKSTKFEIIEGNSGEDALEKAKEHRAQLILVDYNMPGMNGLEFVAELRKLSGYSDTPVFMVTTESSESMKAEGQKLEIRSWVIKPFRPEQLLMIVKRILS